MASMSSFSSSVNESGSEEEFQLFKTQLKKVQDLIEEYNYKSMCAVLCLYLLSVCWCHLILLIFSRKQDIMCR